MFSDEYQYVHLASGNANSTVTVHTNTAVLAFVTINTTSAQALTIKDGQGNTVAILKASIAEGTYTFKVSCPGGIKVTVPASYSGDATIAFR